MMKRQCEEANWTIHSDGTIISNKTNKPRKTNIDKNGYETITYTSPTGTKNYYVHRLVAKYFIGECPEGKDVNHKDGNKANNDWSNLEYLTKSENIRHADRTGLRKVAYGENNSQSKLSNEQAKSLIYDLQKGMSNGEASEKYRLHSRYVSLIRHKKRWKRLWQELEGATTSA